MKAQKWIMNKQFSGEPTEENIKLVEFELEDELKENEVLLQAVYLSVDPYMRIFPTKDGEPIIGEQLSEVIKTRNGQYPIGTLVLSNAGWVSHYISNGEGLSPIRFDLGSTPISYTLGALGMPGATAFLALDRCNPKQNETILITAAAGAVGSIVGQLAKLKGLTVIGLVGSDEKLNWCKQELGFDHVFNYKKVHFSDAIKQVAPDGIDIFFDMVGGQYYHTVINKHMKKFGRILACGSIETYNSKEPKLYEATNVAILVNELTVYGFMIFNHYEKWPEAFVQMNKMIQGDKLKVREQVYVGFENMRDAFFGLFKGENIGKAVVKTVNEITHYGRLY